jgi:MOSC domain-containing protein YiiM
MQGRVIAVSQDSKHRFHKTNQLSIRLLAGMGVEHDAHAGPLVKHRYLAARDPNAPNLRQVHLIQGELLDELCSKGFTVTPGDLGENITTRGLDLPALPLGARLRIGANAVVEVTGLRSPCLQFDRFQRGLKAEMIAPRADGRSPFRSGIMGIVLQGGEIARDDEIRVDYPAQPWTNLPAI